MPISPFLSRTRSLLADPSSSSAAAPALDVPSRSSSAVFPSLTRLNTAHTNGHAQRPASHPAGPAANVPNGPPTPLLSLRLSGPSFLDVVVRDRADKEPVYIIETIRDSTLIHRVLPGSDRHTKVASVQWPNSVTKSKIKSGRTVQMADGRWRDAEDFLKLGPLGSVATRKFSIPHYPHSLKWKLIPGGHFYCSTAGANGPFAILDSAVLNAPARLSVFHNCLQDSEDHDQENYKGVPVMLLDYLIATALLLVTEVQEWLDRPQRADGSVRIPGSSAYSVQRWLAIIHGDPVPPSPPPSPADTVASTAWTLADRRISGATTSSGPRSAVTSDFSSTPSTPATSVHSGFFSSGQEEVPPVPPLPDLSRWSQQDMPQSDTLYRNSHALGSSHSLPPRSSPPPPPPPLQAPSRPQPVPSSSLRPSRIGRQLPTPPTQQPQTPVQLHPPPPPPPLTQRPSTAESAAATIVRSDRARSPSPSMISSTSSGSAGSRRSHYRNSARSSLARGTVPPPLPPPSDTLPLPPKLAQEYQASSSSRRASTGYTSSPLAAIQGTSALQPANPDPLNEEEQERMRQMTEMALTARQYQYPSQPQPLNQAQASSPMNIPPPPPIPSLQHHPQLSPPVESFARRQMTDGGPVRPRDASARHSYAETIYEMPPPAYDAIDFSAPQVGLPQRAHGR